MKKSELRELIKEEIQRLREEEYGDGANPNATWPVPYAWLTKYFTMDHGTNGPRFFDNKTHKETDLKTIAVKWQKKGYPKK